ncbi:centromere protein R [Aegotheles albertisi]
MGGGRAARAGRCEAGALLPGGRRAPHTAQIFEKEMNIQAKRALKLDAVKKENPSDASLPLKSKKENLKSYSPTTGTRQMSPFSSPISHNAHKLRNDPSNGAGVEQSNSDSRLTRRGQPQTEKDEFVELQSKVKSSLTRILEIRASLTSLQALEGSGELGNIIGVSNSSCILSAEVQKTQVLMSQAEELQLLKRNPGKLPAREYVQAAGSAAFLRSLLE